MLIKRLLSTSSMKKHTTDSVLSLWNKAQAVCFDVDSTVIQEEGIDVLAEMCGAGEAVSAWTKKAMGGSTPFEVALAARLELCKPSIHDIHRTLKERPFKLTPNIKPLIHKLHSKHIHVYLVSGGFKQMIDPIAKELDIPNHHIYANDLLFDTDGKYKGFDTEAYTSRSGGKARVIEMLKLKHKYSPIFMIGDGATDMEARPPADAFIG